MLVSLRSVPGVAVIAEFEKTPPFTVRALLAEVAPTCTPDSEAEIPPRLRIALAGVLEAFSAPPDAEPLSASGEQATKAEPAPVTGKFDRANPLLLPKQL
jgi:hypothetical protein